jgi:hypothetical protein
MMTLAPSMRSWSRRLAGIATIMAVAGSLATPLAASARALGAARVSPMTLAQAPRGLQAAISAKLGAPAGPSQQAELTPTDGIPSDFGWSVAISGSTAVVGAPHCLHTGCPGAAYVFVNSGGIWSQQAKLTASDGVNGDDFGRHIAISGSTVVVGVPAKDQAVGAVYVFVRSGGIWSQQAELAASDGASGDGFGISVAIAGSTMLAGASGVSIGGAVYVFVRPGTSWMQQAKLKDPDGLSTDDFGTSVALYGSTALIGAIFAHNLIGAAYVFVRSGGIWSQQAELTASDGVVGVEFGHSVAIYGSTALVGAPVNPSRGPGTAYVFVRAGPSWTQQAELTSGGTTTDEFGYAVAVAGATAVVGAYYTAPQHAGAAYVYVNSGGIWSEQATLTASDAAAYDNFGYSVGLYRSTAVIGAPVHGSNGAAYVFVNVLADPSTKVRASCVR